jgi:hypothetical protein
MGLSLRSPSIAAFVFAVSLCHGTPLRADSIPLPTVDYAAKAIVYGGGTLVSRYSNGKMRVESQVPGVPLPAVSFIDLMTRKMVTTVAIPGMGNVATEVDFSDEGKYGVAIGQGRRVGSATVAGENCELWEMTGTTKKGREQTAIACLTRDSIALRVEATIKGKQETVFEVTEIKRGPQDPKLLAPPANLQVMKLPKDMRELLRP